MSVSGRGKRKRGPDVEQQEKVACLVSMGIPKKAIAAQLGYSASMIATLCRTAEDNGLLARAPEFHADDTRKAQIAESIFGNRELLEGLNRRFAGPLRQLHELDDGRLAGEAAQQRMTDIAARSLLVGVLPVGKRIGVAWGPTIGLLVESVRRAMVDRHAVQDTFVDCEFVQTCGDPPSAIADPAQRGSTLVAALNASLTGKAHSQFTFSVGASVPEAFSDSELEVIRRYIRGIGGYGQIFGPFKSDAPRLRLKLDMLITSCGSGRVADDRWVAGCAAQEGIATDELERLVVGNIGGIWLPRDGLSNHHQAMLETINTRWNGMALADIRDINMQPGGVVCIALDDSKREVVVELLRRRLVSRLFVSRPIARHLERVLEADPG